MVASSGSLDTCGSPLHRSFDSNINHEIVIQEQVRIPHSERTLKAELHTSLNREQRQVNLHGVIFNKTSRYWGLSHFSFSMLCPATQQLACTAAASVPRVPGLSYKRYESTSWSGQVTATGVHTNIANMWTSGTILSVEYDGFFYTGQYGGIYTFFCSSDDFSQVSITTDEGLSQAVCTVPTCCTETSGSISLEANEYYKIKIRFNQGVGPSYLTISFSHTLFGKRTDGTGFYYSM